MRLLIRPPALDLRFASAENHFRAVELTPPKIPVPNLPNLSHSENPAPPSWMARFHTCLLFALAGQRLVVLLSK